DSRTCTKGDVFFALSGLISDGNAFIAQAISRGAVAVVSENREMLEALSLGGTAAGHVPQVRHAMSAAAACFSGFPSRSMNVVGITGTNGKSTTAFLLKELLEAQGIRTGLMGTIGNYFEDWQSEATHTTPESVELQSILKEMKQRGASHCIMEVSSH